MLSSFLISQHSLPTTCTLYIDEEAIARWLNGYLAFWHPAAVSQTQKPPLVEGPGFLTGLSEGIACVADPDTSIPTMPDTAGHFLPTLDAQSTNNNLFQALGIDPAVFQNLDQQPALQLRSLGFAYLTLNGLFEAMNHENLISHESFWEECQLASKDWLSDNMAGAAEHLRSAAQLLQSAREVLHSSNIYLVDLVELKGSIGSLPHTANQLPTNLLASSSELEILPSTELESLKELGRNGLVEVVGGLYSDHPQPLQPLSARFHNLETGCNRFQQLLGSPPKVFLQKHSTIASDSPRLLHLANIQKAVLLPLHDTAAPAFRGPAVSWSSHVGRQVEAFCREPLASSLHHTFFHLAYHLGKVLQQDSSPTLAFFRNTSRISTFYSDFLNSAGLAQIFGNWQSLSSFLHDVYPNEYPGPISQEDFNSNFLEIQKETPNPVSSPHQNSLAWKKTDAASTLLSLGITLGGDTAALAQSLNQELNSLQDQITVNPNEPVAIAKLLDQSGENLARRLLQRGAPNTPGYLFINPCSFTRRTGFQADPGQGIATGKNVLATNASESLIEVPGLGFTWVPAADAALPPIFTNRFKVANETSVRNEFFETEIDPKTGAIRAFRDLKARLNRLNILLASSLGSTMQAEKTIIVSDGPIRGEIETHGSILASNQEPLARFKMRLTAWLGRPVLDLDITLDPIVPQSTQRHHDYLALRFAWPKDQVRLLRGIQGKLETPSNLLLHGADFIEWRWGTRRTFLFHRSLPFLEKHGDNNLDLILLTQGESERNFKVSLGLDRDHPYQIATALDAPIFVQKVEQGPPPSGPTGWLFHIDAPNLVLHRLFPGKEPGSIIFLLEETEGFATPCEIQCIRDPKRACMVDLDGNDQGELVVRGDTITLYPESHGIMLIKVSFP